MDYVGYLKELKEREHLTNAEVAERSKLPLPTVTRIFSGATPNPSIETVTAIAKALGGSLDDMAGIRSEGTETAPSERSYSDLLYTIQLLEKEVSAQRREKRKLAIFLAAFISVILLILIIDMVNGHIGYIRY